MADQVVRRPGGRSGRIRRQVLDAALAVLGEQGLDGLTLDAVAQRSGVHRSTLYRRWGTPSALALDALLARSDAVVNVPDTGSLEDDLRSLLADVAANLQSPLGASVTLALISDRSSDGAEAARAFWDDRLGRMAVVLERAVAKGEVDDDAVGLWVLEAAVAPLFFRLVMRRAPIDEQLLTAVARVLAEGLRRPVGGSPTVPSAEGSRSARPVE